MARKRKGARTDPPPPKHKGPLFDTSVTLERRVWTGATIKVRLQPLPGERVRVLEYHRKGPDDDRFHRRKDEEGYEGPFAGFNLGDFADVFPTAKEAA